MPGSISDSYDPEFGTGAVADEVREALKGVKELVTQRIGSPDLMNIVDVVRWRSPRPTIASLTSERNLRLIRFAINRALETL